MKPLVQKLPLEQQQSFVARTYRTPNFEVGWHQHLEYELILFTEGAGMSFIGNHVGEFNTGDIYLLGSELPHTFQKNGDMISSAVVVQFLDGCFGKGFFDLPENSNIRSLLSLSGQGLKIRGATLKRLRPMVRELEKATGFHRIALLGSCLELIATSHEYSTVSTQALQQLNNKDKDCIERIFSFTIEQFRDPITLKQVAGSVSLSIPAFCNYFKRRTQKTYIDFLNEVRVGYACSQLLETTKPVIDICYESGYNTMVHFHRQFLRIKGLTPLQFRKTFAQEIISRGNPIGIEVTT